MKPTFSLYDDDPRKTTDKTYPFNKGSFAQIIDGINSTLLGWNRFAFPHDADIVGAASSLSPLRGFTNKQRFWIHAWETDRLPTFLVQWAQQGAQGQRIFALSNAVAETWRKYGIETPVVDIGVDANFWHPIETERKTGEYLVTMLTCANFRSNVGVFLDAAKIVSKDYKNVRFIIKNTHEGATKLPKIIENLRSSGVNIEYILGRWDAFQIRELLAKSDLVVYIPSNTGAGIPILEAGAMGKPVMTLDYAPCNGYPAAFKVPCKTVKLDSLIPDIEALGLPFEFPRVPGLEPEECSMFKVEPEQLANLIGLSVRFDRCVDTQKIRNEICANWSWQRATKQLLSHYGISLL